jgi:hypothetical protein
MWVWSRNVFLAFCIVLLVSISILSGCIGKQQQSAVKEELRTTDKIEKPDFPLGTVWSFRVETKDKSKKLIATMISKVQVKYEGYGNRTIYMDEDKRIIELVDYVGDTETNIKYSPPLEKIDYPLTIGKKWSNEFAMEINSFKGGNRIASGRGTISQRGEVLGFMEYTFKGKTYNCAQIKISEKVEYRTETTLVGEVVTTTDQVDYGVVCPGIGEVKFTTNARTLNKYAGTEAKDETSIEMTLESLKIPE